MKSIKFHVTFIFQLIIFVFYFSSRVIDIILSRIFNKDIGYFYGFFYKSSLIFDLNSFNLKSVPKDRFDYSKIKKFIQSEIIILVAGPYIHQQKFTYCSLKSLRDLYPTVAIVFSTDTILKQKTFNSIEKLGVKIILNKKIPTDINWRVGNLRSQINNITTALDNIDSLPGNYILRMRSDQLISKEDFLFSIAKYFTRYNLGEEKILKISMNSYLKRIFSTSDMFMFSEISVMKNYWRIDENDLSIVLNHLNNASMEVFPESIIDSLYFSKVYGYLPSTFDDYIKFIKDKFIFIDECNIGVIWHKKINLLNYKSRSNMKEYTELSHVIWLDIMDG